LQTGGSNKTTLLCRVDVDHGANRITSARSEQGKYDAPNLRKILADEKIQKIFHFARFDLAALQHYLKVEIKNIYCTKIASKLVRTYTDAHGLKSLCDEHRVLSGFASCVDPDARQSH
jgi:ribonuclease D